MLLSLLGAVGLAEHDPAALRTSYEASRSRCRHGDAGVLLHLHETADPHAFRRELEQQAQPEHALVNMFAHVSTRQGVVSMHAVHPVTLTSALGHPHTRRVEANCVIKRTVPNVTHGNAAELFTGKYLDTNQCEHNVVVKSGMGIGAVALVTLSVPHASKQNPNATCVAGYQGTKEAFLAPVQMFSAYAGTLTMATKHGPVVGNYMVDPNGRLQDEIRFASGISSTAANPLSTWVKIPGHSYVKDSAIGPMVEGAHTRVRNPSAYVRWNWGLDRIDQADTSLDDTYRDGGATGNGTRIYLLDTGVAVSHRDFGGRATAGMSVRCSTGEELDCLGKWVYQGVIDDAVLARDRSNKQGCDVHGTHTASTAVGSSYGVAAEAELVAVQVLDCTGESSEADVAAGIEWVVEHAAKQTARGEGRPSIISLSLGGAEHSHLLDQAVRDAHAAGVLSVVAAGNDGGNACNGSPAGTSQALTVGASGLVQPVLSAGMPINGTPPIYDLRANFSDTGSCVDVFAPGVEILAAIPVHGSPNFTSILSGTSMAAPIVSGVVLQILSLYPTFTPDDVTRAVMCMSLEGGLRDVDAYTHNRLVQGGRRLLTPTARRLIEAQRAPEGVIWDATQCHRPSRVEADVAAEQKEEAEMSRREQRAQRAQQMRRKGHEGEGVLLA